MTAKTETSSVILERFELGAQWPTIDPFLFIAHHRDRYPRGRDDLGPDASLAGREIGQDFADHDGWNMYHGHRVPGFPQHPHRGFETITYVRQGLVDHADSLGAAARYGNGDTQWMTAGAGIVHSEMFPLIQGDAENPAELFQIWLNLPAARKMADPAFKMFWSDDIPVDRSVDEFGREASVTVIAGTYRDLTPPSPPPDSRAAEPDSDVAIWHVHLDARASIDLPAPAHDDTERVIYAFEGGRLDIAGDTLEARTGARVAGRALTLAAGEEDVDLLVLQGRPIAEPVAQYGPFVLNDRAGVQQAMVDYNRTGFGGWPWPRPDPVHGRQDRFARHPDGTTNRP